MGTEPGNIKSGLVIENSLESESAHVYVESRGEMVLFLLLNSKITPLQNRREGEIAYKFVYISKNTHTHTYTHTL